MAKRYNLPVARGLTLVCGVGALLYLLANCYVTTRIRFPLPVLFALPILVLGRRMARVSGPELPAMPGWLMSVVAMYALAAFREPLANLTYLVVLLATFGVFRRYVGGDHGRYSAVCRLYAVMLLVSSLFLLMGYGNLPASLAVRARLFGDSVYEFLVPPTGLALWIHLYGYQAAALGGIAAAWLFRAGPTGGRRSVLDAVALAWTAGVLLLSWQRSAVLSAAVAFAVAAVRNGPRRLVAPLALVSVIAVVGFLAMPELGVFENTVIQKNKTDALKDWRLQLQLETLSIIASHPWGLDVEGTAWGPEIFKWGGALSQRDVSGHNAYLMKVAYLGLPVVLLIGYLLATTLSLIWRQLAQAAKDEGGFWPSAMALALLATLLNAVLHNASVYTAEGSTIFAYVALWHWDDLRRASARQADAVRLSPEASR